LAKKSGIETPTREDLARFDRRRSVNKVAFLGGDGSESLLSVSGPEPGIPTSKEPLGFRTDRSSQPMLRFANSSS
jgi:hypothetical protein